MKKLFLVAPLALVFACGGQKEKENQNQIALESQKDSLSYSLGALNAQSILDAPKQKFKKLDKDLVIKGFNENFNDKDFSDCQKSLLGLFGPYGQDFDTTYLKKGSECFGRMTSGQMYKQLSDVKDLESFNIEMIKKGFEQSFLGLDTANISKEDQKAIMQEYAKTVEAKMKAEMEEGSKVFWEEVLKRDVKEIDGTGVYIETLQAGKGGSPEVVDDVEAHYTLYNPKGEKIESSLDAGQTLKMNLGGLIQGWQIGFPAMKKGGKYMLYVPSDKAYGNGPLKFEIEFINFGKAGTIAPTRQQMPPQY